jgi:hypothetical protein
MVATRGASGEPASFNAADAAACVFFDLDDTLIDVNSGWLWVKHEWVLGRITVVRLLGI